MTLLQVGLTGKVSGAEAMAEIPPFEQAALEVQTRAVRNELTVQYGLSVVAGQLLELYLIR
jgi:hypothetical protein